MDNGSTGTSMRSNIAAGAALGATAAFKALENIEPSMDGSVVKQPLPGEYGFGGSDFVINIATFADQIPAWGTAPMQRDRLLRAFWPTESMLASALYTTVSRYASFGWQLDGPPRLVKQYEKLLHSAEFGQGWIQFVTKLLLDVFTQDNGGFIEIVRESDSPTSPVVSINHLDSNQCIRTGRTHEPVLYYDRWGVAHVLKWYQCVPVAEFPSPVEIMRGMQYCAVTRMLRAAQIMRDITVFKHEKISGRFTKAVWLVGGIQTKTLNDALGLHQADADSQGLTRYIQPLIVGGLDPNAKVSAEKLDLASLPDGFDEDKYMRWYVNQIALAFGTDYQEYGPLPGGGLGSGNQAETMHLKSRGKGPRLFMATLEHIFNWLGILPTNVTFTYGDQDIAEDMERARLRVLRAEERATRIKSGELTPAVARQLAVDVGDLDAEYLDELDAADAAALEMQQAMVTENPEAQSGPTVTTKPEATSGTRTRVQASNRPNQASRTAASSSSGSNRVRAANGSTGIGSGR